MTAPDDVPEFNDLSVNDRIDLICDQFEKAWLAGMQPRIEDFLSARFSADERLRLLRELLIAELELRRKTGTALPSLDDYRQRFPEAASVIEEVFQSVAKPYGDAAELFAATMLTGTGSADAERHSKVGDYELLHEIARGGMGVVYKARHTKLGRLAAVKLIRSGDLAGEEEIRRFYAEAEAASQLDHPGIVPLFEAGQENGQHYLAMAFVDGPSLWQKVKEQPLEPREAAHVMQQVAEAVQHAHERGIIHRDLKPQNILMTSTGQPRVTDFGLAKQMATDSSLTATGQVMGTPSYMPPEQASGSVKELDHLADVYSLGATLYCLLTGRPPFQAATLPETLRQVCEVEPVAPRLVNPSIPLDLETICLKALRKEPDRRYGTAQEFADDLGRFLMGESILARPVGQSERFMRWCRRKPLVAAVVVLSVLLVVALAVGMPVVTSAMLEAKKQKTFAEGETARAEGETTRAKEAEQLAKAEKTAAVRQSRIAEVRRLTAESRSIRETLPIRSTLLAVEAIQSCPAEEKELLATPENELRECLKGIGGFPFTIGSQTPMVISPDGRWLAMEDDKGTRIWNLKSADLNADSRLLIGRDSLYLNTVHCIAFSYDGRWLATGGRDTVQLWDLTLPDRTLPPRVLSGHKGWIYSLAFSSDGHWLATGSEDLTARLWDLTAPDPTDNPRVLSGHESHVVQLTFSPDCHWLISSGWTGVATLNDNGKVSSQNFHGTARLWDLTSLDPNPKSHILNSGQNGAVTATAISPNGHWLATGYADGPACLWDLSISDPMTSRRVLSGHNFGIQCLSFSPDGQWLATGGSDATARLWDVLSSNPSANPKVLSGHATAVYSLAFSPEGRWFVTGGGDQSVRLWDLRSSSETSMKALVLRGHKDMISQLAVSPDGHWLITCGQQERAARIWDLTATDPSTTVRVLPDQEGWIRTLLSPDGHWLVTRPERGMARLWDLESPFIGPQPLVLKGHLTSARSTITPNGHWLATRSGNSAWLWDLTSRNPMCKPRVLRGHEGNIQSLALNHDGQWLATASDDKTVRLWNLAAPETNSNPRVLRGLDDLWNDCLAISADGHWLAAGCRDGTIKLWDLNSPDASGNPHQLRGNKLLHWLGFAASGNWLVTASQAGTIQLWNLDSPEPGAQPSVLSGNEANDTPSAFIPVTSVMTPNGKWLLSKGSADSDVRLWDLTAPNPATNSREIHGIYYGYPNFISPDGRWLASGSTQVRVSDLTSPNPSANRIELLGHESDVECWAFTADGHWLATGDKDTQARVWDLTSSNPSAHPRVLRGMEGGGPVKSIAISPDGGWCVTVNRFGVQIWDLQLDRLVALAKTTAGRSLSSSERAQYQLPQNRASDSPLAPADVRDILPTWPTDEHFHERQATEREKGGSLFAAVFHLKRLSAFRPDDQDIKKRLVHAEMRRANGLPTITYESLTDGSFETGSTGVTPVFSGWKVSTWLQRPESAFITATQFKVGQKALEIVAKDGDDVQCQQAVKVKPNTRYRFRGWVKTRDVAVTQEGGKTGACLSVVELGISDSLVGTSDWKQLQIEFDSGNRTQIQLGPRLGCAGSVCIGTAWFDDLQLEELTNGDGNNSSGASDGK